MSTTTATPASATNAKTGTTLRGMATASFCLGIWSDLTFWWYPFGLMMATIAIILGLVTMACGIRAGRHGENLALGGVIFGLNAFGMAAVVYRGMQFFFEGTSPLLP